MSRLDASEIITVFRKDLIEVLRDYRTLLIMIIMPIVVYPVMLILPSRIAHQLKNDVTQKSFSIVLTGDSRRASKFFKDGGGLTILKPRAPQGTETLSPEQIADKMKADLVIDFSQGFSEAFEQDAAKKALQPIITVFYDGRNPETIIAIAQARQALNKLQTELAGKRLEALGVKRSIDYSISIKRVDLEKESSYSSEPLRNVLPFLLFTMISVAIIYPSLDVITGERERNTMPLLLMTPTSRQNIMLGKFLVVCLIGILATIFGLISLYLFIKYGTADIDEMLSFRFPLSALFTCTLITTPLVVALSSLSILLASWCRTFQQGQGYFLPFLLVIIGITSVCSLPNLKLSSGIALIPVVNIALALKEVLSGSFEVFWIALSLIVTSIFAVYVTRLASRVLDNERLLFGLEHSTQRRRAEGDYFPELFVLAVVSFLMMFYVGQFLQTNDIVYGTILTQLIVILLPSILLLKITGLPLRPTWSFKPPRLTGILCALLLLPPCIFGSSFVYQLQSQIAPAPEMFTTMFTRMIIDTGKPLYLTLLAVALAPGICEELMFRGTVLGLVRKRLNPLQSSLLVGLLFGLFHLSVFRIIPTGFLGVLLTFLTIATGSIIPSMLLHTANNAVLVLVARYQLESQMEQFWPAAILCLIPAIYLLKKEFEKTSNQVK